MPLLPYSSLIPYWQRWLPYEIPDSLVLATTPGGFSRTVLKLLPLLRDQRSLRSGPVSFES